MSGGQNWQQGGYGRPPAYNPGPPPGYNPGQPPQQWGAQPPGGRGKKAVLTVVVALVLVGLVVGGAFLKNNLGGEDEPTVTNVQLSLPVSFGDFHIGKPVQKVTEFDQDRLDAVGLSNPKGSTATYYAGVTPQEAENPAQWGGREVTVMSVFGAWGDVADPGKAVDALFAYGIEQGKKAGGVDMALVGDPEPQQPSGLEDATMKCQYAQVTGVKIAVCVWADDHTLGFVSLQRQTGSGPVDLPLRVAADHVAALRTASMVKNVSSPA